MKLQINTYDKTIKIDQEVNLKELSEILLKLFPKLEWHEYKLIPTVIVEKEFINLPSTQPFQPYQETGIPWWEWQPGTVTYSSSTIDDVNFKINESEIIYNIEIEK